MRRRARSWAGEWRASVSRARVMAASSSVNRFGEFAVVRVIRMLDASVLTFFEYYRRREGVCANGRGTGGAEQRCNISGAKTFGRCVPAAKNERLRRRRSALGRVCRLAWQA